MTALPLSGVRVLDLSRLLPGPFGTLFLADFGAEVIRIEEVREGEPYRHVAPMAKGHGGRHLLLNRNKRSVALNLKDPRGREIFCRLADTSQVVFEQFRPGVMARLGIDYKVLSARNPRLVYCSLSGFGQDGPYRDVVGHDPTYLGLTGALSLYGQADGPPTMPAINMIDYMSGVMSALAITIALRHAERTGQGQHVDLSLFETALSTLVFPASRAFFEGRASRRGEDRATGRFPCAAVYECADGEHVVLCAIEGHFWANLCRFFGRDDYAAHQYEEGPILEEMFAFFRQAFKTRPRDEWVQLLWDKDVCIAPVRSVDEALVDPQVLHREMVTSVDTPGVGPTPQLGVPIKMSATPGTLRQGAPLLGQDTSELLKEIGYSLEDIEILAREGVVKIVKRRTEE